MHEARVWCVVLVRVCCLELLQRCKRYASCGGFKNKTVTIPGPDPGARSRSRQNQNMCAVVVGYNVNDKSAPSVDKI
jgi:hypothetical protein